MGIQIGENRELKELLQDSDRCAEVYGTKPVLRITNEGSVIVITSGEGMPKYNPMGYKSVGEAYKRLSAIGSRVKGIKYSPYDFASGLEEAINKTRKESAADIARDKRTLEVTGRAPAFGRLGGIWHF